MTKTVVSDERKKRAAGGQRADDGMGHGRPVCVGAAGGSKALTTLIRLATAPPAKRPCPFLVL